MVKIRLVKLITATLFFLLGVVLVLYFTIAGFVGVFVISQNIMENICEKYREVSDTVFFVINIINATFLGMLPFGVVAAKYIPICFEKWNIPTIQDAKRMTVSYGGELKVSGTFFGMAV